VIHTSTRACLSLVRRFLAVFITTTRDRERRASSTRSRRDSERDTRQRCACRCLFTLRSIPRSAGLRTGSAIIPRKKLPRKAALRPDDGDSFRPSGRTAWRARLSFCCGQSRLRLLRGLRLGKIAVAASACKSAGYYGIAISRSRCTRRAGDE